MLHDGRDVQPYPDLRGETGTPMRQGTPPPNWTAASPAGIAYVRDDGDEGVCYGERQRLRGAELEAVLHEREAVLPTE